MSDPLTGFIQTIASLAPGANQIFYTSHSIVLNDLNSGQVANTATASFTYGGIPYSESGSITISANQNPGIAITKNVSETSYSAVGNVLHYTIIVRNTGNVTLSNITVSDPLAGLNQTITLAPGASSTFNPTHIITQNDINTGQVTNTARATVSYGGTTYSDTDSQTVNANQNPQISVAKTSSETTYTRAGDIIHCTVVVTNSGNVTLTNVVVNDANAQLTCSGSPYTLAPNTSRTCTATHTVTAADVISGIITNTASATGNDPNNNSVSANSNIVTARLNNLPPVISCPASVNTVTSPTTCNVLINYGLAAVYSDPNSNIISLTWTMTGATTASSPATGINNLSSYTFNAGVTNVTYTVTDGQGLNRKLQLHCYCR